MYINSCKSMYANRAIEYPMKRFLVAFLITAITFCYSTPEVLADQTVEQKINKLEQKVSKKFSKTFCNSTGFGISSEGALRFALGETKSEFSKNPLIDKLDLDIIKEQILVDVSDTCYFFDLKKEDLAELTLKKDSKS